MADYARLYHYAGYVMEPIQCNNCNIGSDGDRVAFRSHDWRVICHDAAQTNGLNQLPRNLYPDGTALVNTLMQVSGSIGTALAITIMSASQNSFLKNVADPTDPSLVSTSLTAGVQTAFILGIGLAVSGLIVSFFL